MLEIPSGYWGVTRDDTIQKSTGKAKFTSAEGCTIDRTSIPIEESTGILSLTQCCPSPELGRFGVHSLHSWLIGKRTLGEGFKDKEVSKLREAITVLGYQF
jgi:hypothetical protein